MDFIVNGLDHRRAAAGEAPGEAGVVRRSFSIIQSKRVSCDYISCIGFGYFE